MEFEGDTPRRDQHERGDHHRRPNDVGSAAIGRRPVAASPRSRVVPLPPSTPLGGGYSARHGRRWCRCGLLGDLAACGESTTSAAPRETTSAHQPYVWCAARDACRSAHADVARVAACAEWGRTGTFSYLRRRVSLAWATHPDRVVVPRSPSRDMCPDCTFLHHTTCDDSPRSSATRFETRAGPSSRAPSRATTTVRRSGDSHSSRSPMGSGRLGAADGEATPRVGGGLGPLFRHAGTRASARLARTSCFANRA